MPKLRSAFRGSRKHVLDWTSQPEFCAELLQTIAPVEARLCGASQWMPRGYAAPGEARLDTFGPLVLPDNELWKIFSEVVARPPARRTPNWDIALGCEIEGRSGLILVEAKANAPELSQAGKPLRPNASAASAENHRRIGQAVAEACAGLRQLSEATAISCDSHYQLANRVAFAWKLASLGVPTVLLYLGFLGDEGIRDAGEPFRDDAHWQHVFGEYSKSVVPSDLLERRLECGAAPAWILVRSRTIRSPSPPVERRAPGAAT